MPTIFAHAAVAATVVRVSPARSRRLYIVAMACAVIPDLDVIGLPGVDLFHGAFAHRGVTHSLAFALLLALAITAIAFRQRDSWRWTRVQLHIGLLLFAVTASHGILDALTNGGPGVAFFAPFNDARYFFSWRPIEVSPLGAGILSLRGLRVLVSEAMWIGIPLALVYAARRARERRDKK